MQNYSSFPMNCDSNESLTVYQNEVRDELNKILAYWTRNTHDALNGGFIGRIDENNLPHNDAPKGAVLNARILWSFSAGYQVTQNADHLYLARIAFEYFKTYFIDPEYGGVYWTVDAQGRPLETKKQIYAIAFAIYACSAFYIAGKNETAKETAIELYKSIEKYGFDENLTGYFEAFAKDWQPMKDLRLSEKDANEKKTMNTHLHVLEAYCNLYKIWPDKKLKVQIENLIKNFRDYIIDKKTGHLNLFFDENWNAKSGIISYGHDIEAAWLLLEAAETINNTSIIEETKKISVKISTAAARGLDSDGALWYEYDSISQHMNKEKHWWVQAEAMVGFLNHWQLTNDDIYLHRSLNAWNYTKEFIKDKVYGEWLWGRTGNGDIMTNQDKAGLWKCPYHNSRACIEIIKRLKKVV
ncbi:MAG: AGE family epimerase/isomerase [Ferruginibacter sp.]